MRVAVVGHVEWIEFARVPEVPAPGAIVHVSERWEEPGGGGAVSAVQLAKLTGDALFVTALGDDRIGREVAVALPTLALRPPPDTAGEPGPAADWPTTVARGLDVMTTGGETTDGPTTDETTPGGATTDGPRTDETTADRATTDGPTTDETTADRATTDGPRTDETTADRATADGPTTDETTADGETTVGGWSCLRLAVAWRQVPQRRGFVHVDANGERTITVIGDRLGPQGSDDLSWDRLGECDAVYFTAGDAEAARHARRARVLVGTARALPTLAEAGVRLDALVASANDAGEAYAPGDLDREPDLVVRTAGSSGGAWERAGGERGEWAATPLPGPVQDAYGCGDSFAAGLTYALAAGMTPADAVLLAARCGAACLTGRGPYSAQLTAHDIPHQPPPA